MTETVTCIDIRNLFQAFNVAIELDQRHVDAMPAASFHPQYNDKMWRDWRADHVSYIEKLLTSVEAIPPAILTQLTEVAIKYEPKVIARVTVGLFAEAVGAWCFEEKFGTAELFVGWLIKEAMRQECEGSSRNESARISVSRWLFASDPLLIAEDPESYGHGH
jgi:hypothetical protein